MSESSSEELTEADVEAAREEAIDAIARLAETYGAKRSYGRLFGLLYFAREPLSLDDLAAESGYAKSTVSTAMRSLERLHLVTRRSLPGEGKRAFFEAETDFWYVFSQLLDQQVRREVETLSRSLEAAEIVLEAGEGERVDPELERIQNLKQAAEQSEAAIDALTSDRSAQSGLVDRLQSAGGD